MKKELCQTFKTQPTSDGWKLQLLHYPANTKKKTSTPVVLCHGLAANKNSCDFGDIQSKEWEQYSLAAYLSQGYDKDKISHDVWVIQLRGRGKNLTFNPKDHPKRYIWCFDDYVEKDIPTILKFIQTYYQKEQQRNIKIHWVGKSMGGMIVYAYGQTPASHRTIQGVITIGSPAIFEYKNPLLELITRIAPRNIAFPVNISELIQRIPEIDTAFKTFGVDPENIKPDIFELYLKIGMNNLISSKIFNHFSVFFRHNTFCKYPRYPWLYDIFGHTSVTSSFFITYDYKKNLYRFTHPLLAIAGKADKAAPPEDVKETVNRVKSKDKTYHLFSKDKGYKANYGHLDLNLGIHAKNEVYPVIHNWLLQHDK